MTGRVSDSVTRHGELRDVGLRYGDCQSILFISPLEQEGIGEIGSIKK